MSQQDAARHLAELFVDNAVSGDNEANDELVEEMLRRAREPRPGN